MPAPRPLRACLTASAFVIAGAVAACSSGQSRTVGEDSTSDSVIGRATSVSAGQAGPTDSSSRVRDTLWRWTFDSARADQAPDGFAFGRTGRGNESRWIVQTAADAPSRPNVIVQTDVDRTSNRFPVAVANEPRLRDARVAVRCKPVSGKVDQACGLVFRYRDANNHYVARANALENNVRLYYVKDGSRKEIASWDGKVTSGAWHELSVEARGSRLRVFWNGQQILEKEDQTFPNAGRIGLWTKADSYTLFDDLTVSALQP